MPTSRAGRAEGDPSAAVQRAHAAIRAGGGRITRPRVLIVDALVGAGHHLTAERLTEIVREVDPRVNEATVYRTLTTLEELGIVYHVHFGHGSSVWHLADDERPHLVCQRCEQVTHADSEDFRALRDQISKRYGFLLRAHFAEVGLCAACREGATPSAPVLTSHMNGRKQT